MGFILNYQVNSIRAIACIAVVIVHVTAIYYIDNSYFYVNIIEYINKIARFGTPLFCIITGFLFSKYFFNQLDIKKFFKSRSEKILIPYILWSVFYTVLTYFFAKHHFSTDFIYNFIFGKSFYHLYFISIIIQFCLLFPFLKLIRLKNDFLMLFLIFLLNFFYILVFKSSEIPLLSERASLGFWIFYFFFGIYFNRIIKLLPKFNTKTLCIFFIFVFSLMNLEFFLIETTFNSTRIINLFFAPAIFFILFFIFNKFNCNILNIIGEFSMGIYLIHPLVIIVLTKLLGLKLIFSNPITFMFIIFFSTLAITFLMIMIIRNLPYSKFLITFPKK